MMNKIFKTLIFSSLVVATSCSRDYINTEMNSTISEEQLGTSPKALQGLMDGIYTSLHTYGMTAQAGHEDFGHKAVISGLDLMSNDMFQTKHSWFGFYYNYQARISTSSRPIMIWKTYYQQIKAANNILSSIEKTGVNAENKSIYGQALAIRGYCYFMLARIFGPTYKGNEAKLAVPIYTKASLDGAPRSTVAETYKQILSDLQTAETSLQGFTRSDKDKIDITVAQAFLAEVYLEMGNYPMASQYAHNARATYAQPTKTQWMGGFYDLTTVPDVMWGGTISAENTSFVASYFAHFDNTDPNGYAGGLAIYKSIDKRLYDAIPSTDYRKSAFLAAPTNGLPTYANVKFRDQSEGNGGDYVYMRASEMYYIEAEALARMGNEAQAKAVLTEITQLRNPSYSVSATGSSLIDEIILQKRIELWGEGVAFFDMKRLGVSLDRNYAGTNHVVKAGMLTIPAGSKEFILQIPESEMIANPKMVQND